MTKEQIATLKEARNVLLLCHARFAAPCDWYQKAANSAARIAQVLEKVK